MLRAFVILVLTVACFQKASAQLSNAGLVLYMPLNGNAQDASGNNYHGLETNITPATDMHGDPNGAVSINYNSYIKLINAAKLRGGFDELTILVKLYLDSVPYEQTIPIIFSGAYYFNWEYKIVPPNPFEQETFINLVCAADDTPYPPPMHKYWGLFALQPQSICDQDEIVGGLRDSARVTRKWFTHVFVFNRGNMKQYFNCKKIYDAPTAYSILRPCERDSGNEMAINIGNRFTTSFLMTKFTGKMDELRIYRRALGEDEIQAYADRLCKPEIEPVIGVRRKNCSASEFIITDKSVTYGIPVAERKWRITRDNFTLIGVDSFDYTCSRPGNYTVYLDITDNEGYHYLKDTTFNVPFNGLPEHFLASEKSTYYLCGNQTSMPITVTGGTSYQWSPCTSLNVCDQGSVTVTPTADQQYRVTGGNSAGCLDTIFINVKKSTGNTEVFVPSAFTPNNDGVNDVLGIQSASPPGNFQFEVYNRWGERVFKTSYALATWNGTFNYKKQPAGIYLWKLRYSGGPNCPETRKKGTVVLIR